MMECLGDTGLVLGNHTSDLWGVSDHTGCTESSEPPFSVGKRNYLSLLRARILPVGKALRGLHGMAAGASAPHHLAAMLVNNMILIFAGPLNRENRHIQKFSVCQHLPVAAQKIQTELNF